VGRGREGIKLRILKRFKVLFKREKKERGRTRKGYFLFKRYL
jgi:hypothetical protein